MQLFAYQSFITAFHLKFDDTPISKAEKLRHLQSSVIEEPFQVIRHFDLIELDYQMALDILEEKYNHPDRVISEVYHKISTLKRATNTPANLNSTFHELEGHLATLWTHRKNLDKNPRLRDQLIAILIRFRRHNIVLLADIEKAFHQLAFHTGSRLCPIYLDEKFHVDTSFNF